MAEALAGLSIAANVIQIVGFSAEVIRVLKWAYDAKQDAPPTIKAIQTSLPMLTKIVEKAEKDANKGIDPQWEDTLKKLLGGCREEMKLLNDTLKKVVSQKDDTALVKTKKALKTLFKDTKMKKTKESLDYYIFVIGNYQTMDIADVVSKLGIEAGALHAEVMGSTMDIHDVVSKLRTEEGIRHADVMDVTLSISDGLAKSDIVAGIRHADVMDVTLGISDGLAKSDIVAAIRHAEVMERLNAQKPQVLAPPEEVKVSSVSTIPKARRVVEFVRRPAISQKIGSMISHGQNPDHIVVLQGMGGIGKTQLAMEFSLQAFSHKTYDSVFWVDATSEGSALRSFQEIAEKVTHSHPAPRFENDKLRIEFVSRQLRERISGFLMVLDNYDDLDAFKSHTLRDFMPLCDTGHFLITSRLPSSSRQLVRLCPKSCILEVGAMEESEAEELLLRSAFEAPPDPASGSSYHAKNIVKRLGCHPLAIELSAAYILERQKPLSKFLNDFQDRREEILKNPPDSAYWENPKNSADRDQNMTIFTSWELSYKLIRPETEKGKASAHLLNLLAFLYKQGISEDIFWSQTSILKGEEYPDWLKFFVDDDNQWSSSKFEDAVVALKKFRLISSYDIQEKKRLRGITLHPVVVDWIKLRLALQDRRKYTMEATNIVHRYLKSQKTPVETFSITVETKAEVLSYVVVCQENVAEFCKAKTGEVSQRLGEGELAEAGETFALYLEFMGRISEAETLLKTLIRWRELNLDANDSALLRARSLFTEILRLQKKFPDAEKLDRKLYNMRMTLLGDDTALNQAAFERADPERQELMKQTLWSAHDLGWDLEAMGLVEEAEKLQRIAYDGRKELLNHDSPLILESRNNLAHTLRRQKGKTLEALALMRETLEIAGNVSEPEKHLELLQYRGNLQDSLRFLGFLEEAEVMARISYEETCKEWGKDHTKAAASRGQLKDILWDLDKIGDAEELARQNLDIMENSPYSTDISRIDDIAMLLDTLSGRQLTGGKSRRGEINEYAEKARKLVEGLQEESLMLPSTLQDLNYLATGLEVLRASNQLIKLEPFIYKYCRKVYGISDRNTVNSLVRYSSALRAEKYPEEADKECQGAIRELREKVAKGDAGGTNSAAHLAALSWLAVLYKHIGSPERAMEVYNSAFNYVLKDNFIADADYETLYSIQGKNIPDGLLEVLKAEILHKAVLQIREKRYKEHPCVDDSLYAYAWNLRLQNRLPEAERTCQRALDIARKFRGPHRNTMCILKRLAYFEEQLGKHEPAEAHYREVLIGFRKLGTRHMTRVTEALEDLQELLMEQRKWVEAHALISDAIARRQEGWDCNLGHSAGLLRHLAIVTWEIGISPEGLQHYREARLTYEKAWGLDRMKEGRTKQKLIRRMNELLPGTDNIEEEMRKEAEQRAEQAVLKASNDVAKQKDSGLHVVNDGQKTPKEVPTAVRDAKLGVEQVKQALAGHLAYGGKTQTHQVSTKDNEESASNLDHGDVSLSRSSTLGVNSFPEAPDNEPSKINNQSDVDEVVRRMERQMNQA